MYYNVYRLVPNGPVILFQTKELLKLREFLRRKNILNLLKENDELNKKLMLPIYIQVHQTKNIESSLYEIFHKCTYTPSYSQKTDEFTLLKSGIYFKEEIPEIQTADVEIVIINTSVEEGYEKCPMHNIDYMGCNFLETTCPDNSDKPLGFPPEECPLNKKSVLILNKGKKNANETR